MSEASGLDADGMMCTLSANDADGMMCTLSANEPSVKVVRRAM